MSREEVSDSTPVSQSVIPSTDTSSNPNAKKDREFFKECEHLVDNEEHYYFAFRIYHRIYCFLKMLFHQLLVKLLGPLLLWLLLALSSPTFCLGYSLGGSSNHNEHHPSFSLSAYQKARAQETFQTLDASRFHFQILFVDNDNFHGRIVEGVMARVAEYNDALFTLFPSSATLLLDSTTTTTTTTSQTTAPRDAAAPDLAAQVCDSLGLCHTKSADIGTSFDVHFLDDYDLVICMDDDIRTSILRSLQQRTSIHSRKEKEEEQQRLNFYGAKCRLLSEFLSLDFCNVASQQQQDLNANNENSSSSSSSSTQTQKQFLLDMLDSDLQEAAAPFYELVNDDYSNSHSLFGQRMISWNDIYEPRMALSEKTGAAIPNPQGWPKVQAGILLGTAGLTRFCLDTIHVQMEVAFQHLLEQHFCRQEHLSIPLDQAEEQLRKGCLTITGYFSPQQRQTRIQQHFETLRRQSLDP